MRHTPIVVNMDKKNKKIIITLLSGIGNTILFTPTLRVLRAKFPKSKIDVLVREPSFAEVLRGSNMVDHIYVAKEKKGMFHLFKLFLKLKKNNYDICLTAFPSNRAGFNIAAFLIGTKIRITHSYKKTRLRTLSFLQNVKIPANPNIHDVEQNFNFLYLFGINPKKEKKTLFFSVSETDRVYAKRFFHKNNLGNKVISFHPGTSILAPYRQWSKDNFVTLINLITKHSHSKMLIFEGPDDNGIGDYILSKVDDKNNVIIVKESLKRVAAIIELCNLIITTDSGLGHVAAAMGTQAIAIFGPANPSRTRPYGKDHKVVIKPGCSPCIGYPFYSNKSHTKCKDELCLKRISPKEVFDVVKKSI